MSSSCSSCLAELTLDPTVEHVAISADKEVFLLRYGSALEHHGLHSIAVEVL